jgi:hypothetical protein
MSKGDILRTSLGVGNAKAAEVVFATSDTVGIKFLRKAPTLVKDSQIQLQYYEEGLQTMDCLVLMPIMSHIDGYVLRPSREPIAERVPWDIDLEGWKIDEYVYIKNPMSAPTKKTGLVMLSLRQGDLITSASTGEGLTPAPNDEVLFDVLGQTITLRVKYVSAEVVILDGSGLNKYLFGALAKREAGLL